MSIRGKMDSPPLAGTRFPIEGTWSVGDDSGRETIVITTKPRSVAFRTSYRSFRRRPLAIQEVLARQNQSGEEWKRLEKYGGAPSSNRLCLDTTCHPEARTFCGPTDRCTCRSRGCCLRVHRFFASLRM